MGSSILRRAASAAVAVGVAFGCLAAAPADARVATGASASAPAVSALSAGSSPTSGGARLVVTGAGFTGVTRVLFGSTPGLTVRTGSVTTRLTVTVPRHADGPVDVRVQTSHGLSPVTGGDRFVFGVLPSISSVTPSSGSTTGGATVDVLGSAFTPTSTVGFGTTPAARVRYVSPTRLRARVPAHAAGDVDVRVGSAVGTSAPTSRDRFTFRAPPCPRVVRHVSGTLSGDTTWSPACTSAYVLDSEVTVPGGSVLSVAAGTSVLGSAGARLRVSGTLRVAGTAQAPATFGAASDAKGGWDGISVEAGGSVTLLGVVLQQADIALDVAGDASVIVHGRIVEDRVGVRSPDSVVDARDVDWGDASGPSPVGGGTPVSGSGVFSAPWVGWTAPARPGSVTTSSTPPADTTCADALFVGVRGSGEGAQGAAVDQASESDLLGSRLPPVLDAMRKQVLADAGASATVRVLGLRYPATGGPFDSVSEYDARYLDSIYTGADELEQVLPRERARCPQERVVLAGYSQGALVIRLALADLDTRDRLGALRIAAVELIGDPARRASGSEQRLGAAPTADEGVWTTIVGEVALPSSIADRTSSFCHADDDVCDTAAAGGQQLNLRAEGGAHASYPMGDELAPLGIRAADLAYAYSG